MTIWRAGSDAVCVKTDGWWRGLHDNGRSMPADGFYGPRRDQVLQVAAVDSDGEGTFLTFEQWPSVWFAAGLFRPIRPRQTSIAVFEEMLTTGVEETVL